MLRNKKLTKEEYLDLLKNKKRYKLKPISDKQKEKWVKDREIYKQVWDNNPSHRCEECGKYLGDLFESSEGYIIDTFRYSHILSKGAHPKLRHIVENFKLYCLGCHNKWEFEGQEIRERMKTYDKKLILELIELEQTL